MSTPSELSALTIERRNDSHHETENGRGLRFWGTLLGGGLALILAAGSFMGTPEVSVKPAIRTSLQDNGAWGELSATGYIVADRQSTVAAKYTTRLDKLHVREAAEVKAGQVLAELDHRELDALLAEAEAEVARAAASIQQAQAGITNAEAQLAQARQGVTQAEIEIPAAEAAMRAAQAQCDELRVSLDDSLRLQGIDGKLLKARLVEANRADERQTEVNLARARLLAAQQRKVEAEKNVPLAKARLAAAHSGVQAAEAQITSARATFEAAQAAHQAAQARVKTLQTQREDYFVRAPFDGVISERIAEQGEIVAPLSIGGTQAKGAIVTVVSRESLQAEVDVAEGFLERVKTGGRVKLTVDAFPKESFAGTVQRILPLVDRGKATVKVRVNFARVDPRFLPDMGVRGKFLRADAPAGAEEGLASDPLLIPAAAVLSADGKTTVWTIRDGKLKQAVIKPGARHEDLLEVTEGLTDGTQVVIKGLPSGARDEMPVKVATDDGAR